MKPSSLRTLAIAAFSFVAGMSTVGRSMRLALRMRVSMSAIGSVIMVGTSSPAGLGNAGDQPVRGHPPEADAADAELAVDGAGPAADLAAVADADDRAGLHQLGRVALRLVLLHLRLVGVEGFRLILVLDVVRFCGHRALS